MKKLMIAAVALTSCVSKAPTVAESTPTLDRHLSSPRDAWGADASAHDLEPTTYLSQNWSPQEREAFYRTPQGSLIMPLKFALALEKVGTSEAFFTNKNLAGYGFVPQKKDENTNPFELPIGITIDGRMRYSPAVGHSVENGERFIGVNCAACHTGSMHYRGQALRIDGGQSLLDFQSFVRDMDYSLRETLENPEKLDKFLTKVAQIDANTGNSNDKAKLLDQLKDTVKERAMWTDLDHDGIHYGNHYNKTNFVYGPGRNDAFNIIFNEVLARDLGVPDNAKQGEPNVPVSIPVIWDAPQHDWVQWNGLASNNPNEGGPIARNLGQVLGVFGHIDFKTDTKILHGYCSSARRKGLETLEGFVKSLWSPQWPTQVLGGLDAAKVARGKELFNTMVVNGHKCVDCHDSINRTDENRKITAKLVPMTEVGTETAFNDKALARVADSDVMAGKLTRLIQGRKLEKREPAATLLRHAVAGSIAGSISPLTCNDSIDVDRRDYLGGWENVGKKAGHSLAQKLLLERKPTVADDDPVEANRTAALVKKLAVYKARPLNGIWSSPPFLHNGSVGSLYDLMLPPGERKGFWVGCDEFDPVKVGWNCGANSRSTWMDPKLPGNTPVGHDFGPRGETAEADRWALVEYLKSL